MDRFDYRFLASHAEALQTVLADIHQARLAALRSAVPERPWPIRGLLGLVRLVFHSLAVLWQRPPRFLFWLLVCGLGGLFDASSQGVNGTRLAEALGLFLLGPVLLYGWGPLGAALRGALRRDPLALLRGAVVTVLVAHAEDPVLGQLRGVRIDGEGFEGASLNHHDTTTESLLPSCFIQLSNGPDPVLLFNTETGRAFLWDPDHRTPHQHAEAFIAAFARECRQRKVLDTLQQLARFVAEEVQATEEPSLFTPRARVDTGTSSSWASLVIPADLKTELEATGELLRHAATLREQGFPPPSALLLYGPPGTGKTEIARTLANRSGVSFLTRTTSELKGQYVGHSAPLVRRLFEEARERSPAIVFLDEVDALAPRRDGGTLETDGYARDMVAELLVQMDGVTGPSGEVFVVAATNHPERVDPAVMSRFKRQVAVGLPDEASRRQLLALFLQDTSRAPGVDACLPRLAAQTNGFSGRELRGLVETASQRAATRALRVGQLDAVRLELEDFADLL